MIKDISTLTECFKRMAPITWEDSDTEARVRDIIEDADPRMNHMLGAEIDYSAPGEERELFINFCLYRWNGVGEQFEAAYRSDILRIRHKYEVDYARKTQNKDVQ